MRVKAFAIYDSKAAAYSPPFFQNTIATGIRAFGRICSDQESMVCQFPEDYTLFEVGEWDDQTGRMYPLETPRSLGLATEHKARQAEPMAIESLLKAKQPLAEVRSN